MANEIIAREEELERVRAFLDTRDLDGPRALTLIGEAGIGKSTLWFRGVEIAREYGFRVLSSRPAEAEQELAFAGLGDVLEPFLVAVLQSAAAAQVVTDLFGTLAFTDRTHQSRGRPARSFGSLFEAAEEAAISRFYGGIHFRAAIERGIEQGICIGRQVSAL